MRGGGGEQQPLSSPLPPPRPPQRRSLPSFAGEKEEEEEEDGGGEEKGGGGWRECSFLLFLLFASSPSHSKMREGGRAPSPSPTLFLAACFLLCSWKRGEGSLSCWLAVPCTVYRAIVGKERKKEGRGESGNACKEKEKREAPFFHSFFPFVRDRRRGKKNKNILCSMTCGWVLKREQRGKEGGLSPN